MKTAKEAEKNKFKETEEAKEIEHMKLKILKESRKNEDQSFSEFWDSATVGDILLGMKNLNPENLTWTDKALKC